jgi:hypothetical protein
MKRWRHAIARAGIPAVLPALLVGWSPSTHAAVGPLITVSGSMTLSITNGTTFQYDDFPGPRFHLVLTLSQPLSGINMLFTGQIQLENGQQLNANFTGPAADGVTYTADPPPSDRDNSGNLFAIGAHQATATLTYPTANPPITSPSVGFSITKRSMAFSCALGSLLFQPGQTEQVTLSAQSLDSSVPLDWTQGTAAVWLVGPVTFISSNLVPDSSGVVSIPTPMQTGRYALNCSFSGTDYYAPQESTTTNKTILISEMRQLSGVQLYTNPQTLVANQATQMLVVFSAPPGLSTPTGEFNITIGRYTIIYTQSIGIDPNGTASLTLAPIPDLHGADAITIHYFGDPIYNDQSVTFPMTNPAIPGSGGGGGGGAGTARSQATPTATLAATPTATSSVPTSAISSANGSPPFTTQQPGGSTKVKSPAWPFESGGMIALLIGFVLLVMGVAGAYVFWRRSGHLRGSGVPTLLGAYPPETVPIEPALRQEPSTKSWPLEEAPPQQ